MQKLANNDARPKLAGYYKNACIELDCIVSIVYIIHCITLITLYWIVLYYTVLYCTVLHCIALHCIQGPRSNFEIGGHH